MPDIITASEQDAIAAFFASGGTITRRETRVEHGRAVTRILEIDGSGGVVSAQEVDFDHQLQPKCRKTHDVKGRPVNGWHHRYASGPVQESQPESRNEAREVARAVDAAKRVRNKGAERGLATMRAGLQKALANRDSKTRARLGKAMRVIAGEWTPERVALAASELGMKTSNFRGWLRKHGYGEKLPGQRRSGNTTNLRNQDKPKIPPAELASRNEAVCRDYVARIPMVEMVATHGLSERSIARIAREAGINTRGPVRKCGSPPPSDIDVVAAALYASGKSTNAITEQLGIGKSAILGALKRTGTPTRSIGDSLAKLNDTPEVQAKRTKALLLAEQGMTPHHIAQAVGFADYRTVERLIAKAEAVRGAA